MATPEAKSPHTRSCLSPAVRPKSQIKSVVVAPEKATAKKGKSQPVEAPWDAEALYKDAAWFAENCALPDKGETPHSIIDISDDMLKECFGDKSCNGYKMSACTGIPQEEILALSKVVDGYDKPVNGVLSHTFAKGAYAERIQRRVVNWAAYAATKLKGQILQCQREGKPKPDGPPCIRKHILYVPPTFRVPEIVPIALPTVKEEKPAVAVEKHTETSTDDESSLRKSPTDLAKSLFPATLATPAPFVDAKHDHRTTSTELLTLMSGTATIMKARLAKVIDDRAKLIGTISKLKSQEAGHTEAELTLTSEIRRVDQEILDFERKIKSEDKSIEELTADIELESNKEADGDEDDEDDTTLLNVMNKKLMLLYAAHLNWTCLRGAAQITLASTKEELERKRKRVLTIPTILAQLQSLSEALEVERVKIESHLKDQKTEESIVGSVLSKPCLPFSPAYVLTSTNTFLTQATISSCPLCCNGYHCNNWVSASCGHTYHPVCLFTHLTSGESSRKCLACDEPLKKDWLRSWGLDVTPWSKEESEQAETLLKENEDIYGNHCNRLPRRRQWVRNIEKLHSKDDQEEMVAVSEVRSRGPPSVIDEGDTVVPEDGSSDPFVVLPKTAGESVKKRKNGVGSRRKKSRRPSSSSVHKSDRQELTPSATLPFSPTTDTTFKALSAVITPGPAEQPLEAFDGRRQSNRLVSASHKKQLKYMD